MAETAPHELIIIRRHEEEEHAQHSSAWKVAHADFMTAMMAFFLIMWLINVTDDNVRKGIAQYFNPIHMSQGSSELKGLSTVKNADASAKKGHGQMPVPGANINPIELNAGHAEAKSMSPEAAAAALNAAAELAAKLTAGSGISDSAEQGQERRIHCGCPQEDQRSRRRPEAPQWRIRPGGLPGSLCRAGQAGEGIRLHAGHQRRRHHRRRAGHRDAGRRDRARPVRSVLLANGAAPRRESGRGGQAGHGAADARLRQAGRGRAIAKRGGAGGCIRQTCGGGA